MASCEVGSNESSDGVTSPGGWRWRPIWLAVAAGLAAVALVAAVTGMASRPVSPAAVGGGEGQVAGEAPATANDLHTPRAHNSPELAVDPTDERFAALAYRLDDPEFSCGLALSGDGGNNWTTAEVLVGLPNGVDHCYAPQIAFDADGTLYYLFVGLAGEGNSPQGVWLTTSADRGRSFTQPWQVLDENNYQVRLAVDRAADETGRLHLAWLDVRAEPSTGGLPSSHNPVVAAHSDDGGRTWSEPVEVSGDQRRRVVAPNIAVGGEGEIHVVYYDLKDDVRDYQGLEGPVWPDPWAVETASSTDGGQTFSDPVVVDDQVAPPERVLLIFTMPPPSVAAGGDGRVYTAWHDARHGEWDALLARSVDRGRSWDAPVVVGADEPGASRQLLPELAVAPDGRVEVVFFDRPDPDAEHRQHVGYAASTDSARSFATTQRLTSEASDARTGPQFHLPVAQGMVEHGTGLALHAGEHTALAAWPDTRFAVPGTAQQDVYTAAVDRSAGQAGLGSWSAIALAGGAGVGAAALVGLTWHRRRLATSGALVLLALSAVGCDAGEADDDAPLPDGPAMVEIGMDEYAFDVPEQVPAGEVVVEARNRGDEAHELVMVPLPEGTGLEELLSSATPVGLPPTYVVPPREPGETATFTVDLEPGRYGLVCFVEDADGTQHHQHGMFAELEVIS